MSNAAIRDAVEWSNTRCHDDWRCIAKQGHKEDHRDLSKTWDRSTDPTTRSHAAHPQERNFT